MNLIACFPGKYIQGSGTILQLESIIKKFGSKAVVLTSPTAKKYLPSNYFHPPLSSQISVEVFGGECSEAELAVFSKRIELLKAEVVVGMGGGKVIDTSKIAADRAGLPVIIVPTIASTDAPCSGCAVTYTVDGVFEQVHYQRLNPAVVLVDEDIITKAPVRFLIAGMGDALATWFEARSCKKTSSENECGGLSTLAGQGIAKLCYEILIEHGLRAKLDHESGVVSDSLKNIIEANILLSGIGFESGGLASGHAIHNGLTALPETHAFYHGEKVAFGLLAGLHLNHAPEEEIKTVYRFCASVGLPVTLSQIGLTEITKEKLMLVAHKSVESGSSIHHEGDGIDAQQVYDALINADQYGRQFFLKNTFEYMRIEKITDNKKQYLDLLLLADEQEDMIDKYLESGDMFALYYDDLKTVCVVTAIDKETCELKNIATYKEYQGKGYARALIKFISEYYKNSYKTMLVGTGETPKILLFYESCGFEKSHVIKNFFTDNYDHTMFEDGIQLINMVYLKKKL